jgi:prepilin-type N-terminal cleavage/methylation domain-containing protein
MWAKQHKSGGFTIVELLIVIIVIGILAAITMVAYGGIQQRSQESKIRSELSQMKRGLRMLEVDTGKSIWGCPADGNVYNPDGFIDQYNAGFLTRPTVGAGQSDSGTCTWSQAEVDSWKGPYYSGSVRDPWGNKYMVDNDYGTCPAGTTLYIAVILSGGPNGSISYPTSAQTGACSAIATDDYYETIQS